MSFRFTQLLDAVHQAVA